MISQSIRIKLLATSIVLVIALTGTVLFIQALMFVPDDLYVGDRETDLMMKPRTIKLAMYQYSADHGGKYPEGQSSTEIFQKLLDGKYISDPSVFYYPLPGKTQNASGRLEPQNVCWDVTDGADSNSPDDLPIVFLTGYKIVYRAGSKAQLRDEFVLTSRQRWLDWWTNGYSIPGQFSGVCDLSNSARLVDINHEPFIPADFDPKGKTYRQLTPDGELPP